MKYILYQTTNKVNGKIYIGVHGTEDPDKFDGYLGCGCYTNRPATYNKGGTPFKHAILKYGVKNFIRTTIKCFDSEQDAYNLEELLVDEAFVKREDTYNLALGGRNTDCANCKVQVYMYDLDGNFEQEFNSLKEASKFLDSKNTGHLPRAIKQGHQYLGHQFSYEKLPYMKKLKCRKATSIDNYQNVIARKVARYDKEWNLIEVYNSVSDCKKDGYKNVHQMLRGDREFCKGFRFKYLD